MVQIVHVSWDAWRIDQRADRAILEPAVLARDRWSRAPCHRVEVVDLPFDFDQLHGAARWIVEQMRRPAGLTVFGIEADDDRREIGLRYYPDLDDTPTRWIARLADELLFPTTRRGAFVALEARRWPGRIERLDLDAR